MNWFRFSASLTYMTILVLNVSQLLLMYDLFLNTEENISAWFVFSSIVSFLLFGVNVVYYTYIYAKRILNCLMHNEFESIIDYDSYSVLDYCIVAANTSWSIVWALHVVLEILLFRRNQSQSHHLQQQTGEYFTLLSTLIASIALRYPLLFEVRAKKKTKRLRSHKSILETRNFGI